MTAKDILPKTVRAHELYGDYWFNSEPVPIAALRGQVVLIEFWDYTCIHCLRTLPYMMEWKRKYDKFGLVVIGVHTPKFPFGRDPDEVHKAILRLGITFPVVTDNDYLIASRYDARAWPDIFLIDKDGFVRYEASGERSYAETEHMIQTLLYDAGVDRELPLLTEAMREEHRAGTISYRATPELFAGYLKGSIGNIEGYSPESVVEYEDPEVYMEGRLYAVGNWLNDKNSLRLVGGGETPGQIILSYAGLGANAVFKPEGEKHFEVTITQDDLPLNTENKGDDIRLAPDGRSFIIVSEPRLHSLVQNKEFGEHLLKLYTKSDGFTLYSFMFTSSVIPEFISNN